MLSECRRDFGCQIRIHHHCSYSCTKKHKFGEKCKEKIEKIETKIKYSKKDIAKRSRFIERIYEKYKIQYTEILNQLYNLNNIELDKISDTFLSDKAITAEVSLQWFKYVLDLYDKYKWTNVPKALIILLYAELFFSYRYNYLLKNKKFTETIKFKYLEYCNNEDTKFSIYLRNTYETYINEL